MTTVHDPYTPPAAALQDLPTGAMRDAPFFVVSTTKLVALYIGTLGFYPLFWFYMHWRRWRVGRSETVWPVARALFAVFFVHALNRRIARTLDDRGAALRWWPMTLATVHVLMMVIDTGSAILWPWLLEVLPDRWLWLEWIGVLLMPVSCACMVRVQRAANAACGDPQARGNRRFSIYNIAWIVAGLSLLGLGIWLELEEGLPLTV